MHLDNNLPAFFALIRAGLWEQDVRLSQFAGIEYSEIVRLAEVQSVTGLVAAGMEHVVDVKLPQALSLELAGSVLQLEQRNRAMNGYVETLIQILRRESVYTLLMKGQGIAQCYERPLWRACGDIDLLLSNDNYETCKRILVPLSSNIDEEQEKRRHLALTIDNWKVELHGTLRTNLWNRLERMMDELLRDVFYGGNVRSWQNGRAQVFLMRADEDTVFVFAHILQHFYIEGIGLRQICDWCRLLYTYKDKINVKLLEQRIRKAGMMKEWKAFAAFAVEYIGMPAVAMPFYDSKYNEQGVRVMELVMDAGNFGHGKGKSYKNSHYKGVSYMISFGRHFKDSYRRFRLFPVHALLMWWKLMLHGLKGVIGIGSPSSGL